MQIKLIGGSLRNSRACRGLKQQVDRQRAPGGTTARGGWMLVAALVGALCLSF
jgi:hypothetical protein